MAKELEISTSYIHLIENGEQRPSKRLCKDYAKALGVDVETIEFFQRDDIQNQKFESLMLSILQTIVDIDKKKDL